MTRHFINLTNGLEFLPKIGVEGVRYIRIQSTVCEQKDYDRLIMDLDNGFLFELAVGSWCVVYDTGKKGETRAVWQGLEFVRYCLCLIWFEKEICPAIFISDFRKRLEGLGRKSYNKLKYFRKFLLTDCIKLSVETRVTDKDGDYSYWKEVVRKEYGIPEGKV